MSLKKIKSMGGLQLSYEHNAREMSMPHIDSNMTYKNEELVDESGGDYKDMWYRRMKEVELKTGKPVAVRQNSGGSVLAYEIVTSFSREADVDLEKWKQANVAWMKETFGEENVLSMCLHMDETTPHIHSIVVPIDERGHLCAKNFTGGRAKMIGLQTSYGKAMEPLGLKRGEMYSKTKKKDLKRFYGQLNKAANETAPSMNPGEPVDSYVARVNAYIQDISMQSLWKEQKAQRALELEKTKFTQWHAKYTDAIALQDTIEASCGGNRMAAKKRLRVYKEVEESVPRKILSSFLSNLLKKFPKEENVRNWKKKKQKDSDNVDINM